MTTKPTGGLTLEEAAEALERVGNAVHAAAPYRLPPEDMDRVPLGAFLGVVSADRGPDCECVFCGSSDQPTVTEAGDFCSCGAEVPS